MLMKVHNKGQVVIPAALRRELDIAIGDHLEVEIDAEQRRIELRKPSGPQSSRLAGSLRSYASGKPFPTDKPLGVALRHGLAADA